MASSSLLQLIKRIAMEVFNASKPCNYYVGYVKKVSPTLVIHVCDIDLDEYFLIISSTLKSTLSVGDKVVCFRKQGGNEFYIAEKVGGNSDS